LRESRPSGSFFRPKSGLASRGLMDDPELIRKNNPKTIAIAPEDVGASDAGECFEKSARSGLSMTVCEVTV